MKLMVIMVVTLSSFYVGVTKIVMSQIKDLENVYSNTDKIANGIAKGQDVSQYTNSIYKLSQPVNYKVGN